MTLEVSHLVVNGCSFTYCQGLRDPPEEGWPRLLANKLGVPVVNLAVPGSGNDAITRRTYNYFYKNLVTNSKPLFVIAMSQSIRREEYVAEIPDNSGQSRSINDYCLLNPLGGDKNFSLSTAVYQQMNDIGIFMSQERKFRLWASLINLFKANNTPYLIGDYMPDTTSETLEFINKYFPELKKFIDTETTPVRSFNDITHGYPKALDNGHDGIEAQVVLADYIYIQLLKRYKKIIPIENNNFVSLKKFRTMHSGQHEFFNHWYRKEMGLPYHYHGIDK